MIAIFFLTEFRHGRSDVEEGRNRSRYREIKHVSFKTSSLKMLTVIMSMTLVQGSKCAGEMKKKINK